MFCSIVVMFGSDVVDVIMMVLSMMMGLPHASAGLDSVKKVEHPRFSLSPLTSVLTT